MLRSSLVLFALAALLPAVQDPERQDPDKGGDLSTLRHDGKAALRTEAWAEAARCFRAIVRQRPDDADAWYRLGLALHNQGELDDALAAHLEAAKSRQFAAPAQYNVACVRALQGDADAAFAALDRAANAGFTDVGHLAVDADLNGIRSDPRFAELLARLRTKTVHVYDAALNAPRPSSAAFARLPQDQAFAFMATDWQIRNTFINPAGQKATTEATQTGHEHLGGKTIIDHYAGVMHDGSEIRGLTIRAYDAASETWQIVWLDDRQPPKFAPLIGRFENGVGHFYPKGTDAKTATVRFQWDDVHDDRARWMQQTRAKTDQGERWVASWVMEFRKE